MREPTALFVHVADHGHGVARFGRLLAASVGQLGPVRNLTLAPTAEADDLERTVGQLRPDVVHLQFTDLLYARPAAVAAERVLALLAAAGSTPTVVTLHDLPPSHGSDPIEVERRLAYARVAAAADACIVCSHHERRRLHAASGVEAAVIPHFVERRRTPPAGHRPAVRPATVGVLGHLYPGKGHEDVLLACRGPDAARLTLVAVGGPAPRHDSMVDELGRAAAAKGTGLHVTGWVDDSTLVDWLVRVAVPVVANRATSASGSLATWLAVGRRPVVRAGSYTCEVADLAPGCLTLYDPCDPGALAATIRAVLAEPGRGWQTAVPDRLRPESVAGDHLRLYGAIR